MAVVKYGSLVSEVRGSIGGVTFQRCGQSLSVRSNPTHVKAKSELALLCRARLQALANKWSTLAKAKKDTWPVAALDWPSFDKFGSPKILSGYQLYVYINTYRVMLGLQPLTGAPTYNPPGLWGVTLNRCVAADNELVFDCASAPASNAYLLLFLSAPFPYRTSTSYVKQFYLFAVIAGSQASFAVPEVTLSELRQPLVAGLYLKASFVLVDINSSNGNVIPAEELIIPIA